MSDYIPLTQEQIFDCMKDESFWDTVRLNRGAYQCLSDLINRGHSVYIVTAASPESIPHKAKRIKELLPFLSWNNVIIAKDKHLINSDLHIDDGVHNLTGGNYRKCLFNQPWNESFDETKHGIVRVNDFDDVEREIRKLEYGEIG